MNTFQQYFLSFFVADPNELSHPPTELEKSQTLLEWHRPPSPPGKILCMNQVGQSLCEVAVWRLSAAPKVIVLQARAQAAHNGPADVAVKDIVNKRVDTAVGKCQGPTHLHAQLGKRWGRVEFLLKPGDNGQKLEGIKGQPGEDKGWHNNKYDLYRFPQLFVMLSGLLVMDTQLPCDATVAGHNAHQRGKKGKNQGHQGPSQFNWSGLLLCTVRLIINQGELPGQNGRQPQEAGDKPDTGTDSIGTVFPSEFPGHGWVHNGQVAVNTHAGEQEDTAVHVDRDHVGAAFAQERACSPQSWRCFFVHPERQRDKENEVRGGQVQDKDVHQSSAAPFEIQRTHEHEVPQHSSQEHGCVKDGKENRCVRNVGPGLLRIIRTLACNIEIIHINWGCFWVHHWKSGAKIW